MTIAFILMVIAWANTLLWIYVLKRNHREEVTMLRLLLAQAEDRWQTAFRKLNDA